MVKQLLRLVGEYGEKDRCDWSLLSYGWGDGGGGPDSRHLELLNRSRDLEGLPRCKHMKVSEFFHTIDECPDVPTWRGELYFELHRGTYSTQGQTKKNNRKSELLYRDAEFLSSAASPMGLAYPYDELHEQWKGILCHQFHDVLPGSSVGEVYEDTDKMYAAIIGAGEEVVDSALEKIVDEINTSGKGKAVVVFNTLPWGRTDVAGVKLPDGGPYNLLDADGKELASQTQDGEMRFTATVPSMGYATYRLVKKSPGRFKSPIKVSKNRLENGFYRIELDGKGVIRSLVDKATGREVLLEGKRGNLLQLFEDKPNDFDAWDIDFYYDDKWEDITDLQSIGVVEDGPVRGAIETVRKFNKSKLIQRMVIYADIPRIDFETYVDWHEDNKCLKASFPVSVNANTARYEIAFGNIERTTHTNTSWDAAQFEVCAHKWADVSEGSFGVSLMNDCKYGHHTKGNVMRLTLLRSPKEPDPMADMGEHFFTYSLMPHAGDYVEARTVRRAYELNVPMRSVTAAPSRGKLANEGSFFAVDAENVVLETVKRAEREDSTILRLYECHNTRSDVTVKVGVPFKKVYECDLMEDNLGEVKSKGDEFRFEIRPFEIRTFKLVK